MCTSWRISFHRYVSVIVGGTGGVEHLIISGMLVAIDNEKSTGSETRLDISIKNSNETIFSSVSSRGGSSSSQTSKVVVADDDDDCSSNGAETETL